MKTNLPKVTLPSEAEVQARVLYRDGLILVFNKPAGIPVHEGPGGGENLEQWFVHLRYGLSHIPHLAHRLDSDTSGCLVLGRHPKALRRLGKLFSQGLVEKTYWGIVEGVPPLKEGRIDLPLRKQSTLKHRWWMEVHPEGQPSSTGYRVLGTGEGKSWIEFRPYTGRTHQLRVHAAALGCPMVGDKAYNPAVKELSQPPRLHLHARTITLPLYPKKEPIIVTAPPPAHMMEALMACGYREA